MSALSSLEPAPEHPVDVISQALACKGGGAIAVITAVEGGGVREVGSMMAVDGAGKCYGYLSGGCLDTDIAEHAVRALADGSGAKHLRYGAGSPFVDLPLPCGGAIEVVIQPVKDREALTYLRGQMRQRRPLPLSHVFEQLGIPRGLWPTASTSHIQPKIRLRIAGRGAEALALARLAQAAGVELELQLIDPAEVASAERAGIKATQLISPTSLPPLDDDPWTAAILMLHDLEFEAALLKQALGGPAFYIGAVGSKQTRIRRDNALIASRVLPAALDRILGPIGLIPSLRNASELGVSALAQVLSEAKSPAIQMARKTALVVLAAGGGTRFGSEDKLTARFHSAEVLSHPLSLKAAYPFARAIAVGDPGNAARRDLIERYGWEFAANPEVHTGQASSLRCAIEAVRQDPSIEQILVILGDMPMIRRAHLARLLEQSCSGADLIFSAAGETAMPPAIVNARLFDQALRLTGDMGAKALSRHAQRTESVALNPEAALDIDYPADLGALTH